MSHVLTLEMALKQCSSNTLCTGEVRRFGKIGGLDELVYKVVVLAYHA
ncbi:MAG: hypothetical protein AAGC78_03620 [Cellvibrio sp.]